MSDELLGGFTVHPAAAVFPLIEGDEFDDLCDSIRSHGVQHPAVVRGTELLDGRNRMRACERLKAEGWAGVCPIVEWKDDGRNVAEWIWDTNAIRRHMDDDGIVMAASKIHPLIAKENEARKAATQAKQGQPSKNPHGRRGKGTGSYENVRTSSRDTKAENARSTIGQVAEKAGVSRHKARQAVAVQKAIERGELPAETAKEVMAGKKKLRDVAPKAERKPKPKKAEPKHRTMAAILSDLRDLLAEWKNADHNAEVLRDELTTQLERI
jgi:hypothetical protein